MKAIAVTPGQENSARLIDAPVPSLSLGRVLVRVLQVGICGTDAEIHQGLYGEAPAGEDYLIIGHESLGVVERVAEGVAGLRAGDYVAATVRRPDDCINCRSGEPDMCIKGGYKERGIKGLHGFLSQWYVESAEYMVKIPPEVHGVGVLAEPLSIVEKAVRQMYKVQERLVWQPQRALVLGIGPVGLLAVALLRSRGLETYAAATRPRDSFKAQLVAQMGATYLSVRENPVPSLADRLGNLDVIIEATGNSTVAFQAMGILGINGVLCLTGVSAGHRHLEVPSDALNLGMVLGNKTVFGTVNAHARDWGEALRHLVEFQQRWPGLLERLITRRLPMAEFVRALDRGPDDVKTVLTVGE